MALRHGYEIPRNTYGNVVATVNSSLHLGDRYDTTFIKESRSDRSRLLDSLRFAEINARLSMISTAHQKTFEWLFQPATHSRQVEFQTWLTEGKDIFLITGKAGSGKSTLMKFIYNHRRSHELLLKSDGEADAAAVLLFHGFWLNSTELQKSFRGMLLTLVYQLVEQMSESCIHQLLQASSADQSGDDMGNSFARCRRRYRPEDWSETALQECCQFLLRQIGTSVLILVDGLDELDKEDRVSRLLVFFDDLRHQVPSIRLCVSSRPTTWLEQRFAHNPRFRLQDLTHADTISYTNDVLEEEFTFHASTITRSDLVRLQNLVAEKAEGVFLWVKYALHSISSGLEALDDMQHLIERVEELPKGMEALYQHMWLRQQSNNAKHREQTAILLRCIATSQEMGCDLTLFQATCMLDDWIVCNFKASGHPVGLNEVKRRCETTRRLLSIRTAGLLVCEIMPQPATAYYITPSKEAQLGQITYMHRTVHEFLFETEFGRSLIAMSEQNLLELRRKCIWAQIVSTAEGLCAGLPKQLCNIACTLRHYEKYCAAVVATVKVEDSSNEFIALPYIAARYDQARQEDLLYLFNRLHELVAERIPQLPYGCWLHLLVLRPPKSITGTFALILIEHNAIASCQLLLRSRGFAEHCQTHLLSRLIVRVAGSAGAPPPYSYVAMIRELLNAGTSPLSKTNFLVRSQGELYIAKLSPLEVFISNLYSTQGSMDHGYPEMYSLLGNMPEQDSTLRFFMRVQGRGHLKHSSWQLDPCQWWNWRIDSSILIFDHIPWSVANELVRCRDQSPPESPNNLLLLLPYLVVVQCDSARAGAFDTWISKPLTEARANGTCWNRWSTLMDTAQAEFKQHLLKIVNAEVLEGNLKKVDMHEGLQRLGYFERPTYEIPDDIKTY